jgi:hypothetical protein
MATGLGQDPNNFYVWRASDEFAIHLSIRVITQLTAQISRAGNQAGELRGILLGRTIDDPRRATVIEDFEPISPSEGETDDTLFEIACRKVRNRDEQRVLGFYRSRRDGRLNMGQGDLETFSRLFCETGHVALLIQTSRRGNESDAALFYWQHGGAYPRDFGFGFPFDAGQLVNGHPGWRYPDPLDLAPAHTPLPAPEPQEPEWIPPSPRPSAQDWTMPPPPLSHAGGSGIRWSRLAPTILLAAIGIGAIQLATTSKQTVAAAPPASGTAASDTAGPSAQASPSTQGGLELSVTSRPHQLEIRWDRDSTAIATSDKGLLRITEGGTTEVVPIDQTQLRDGYVDYAPKTSEVAIRMDVIGKDGATKSEAIRAVGIP